jgi:hypothetical protein
MVLAAWSIAHHSQRCPAFLLLVHFGGFTEGFQPNCHTV